MAFSFSFLFPIASALLGGTVSRISIKKNVWGKTAVRTTQLMFAAVILYLIFVIMANAIAFDNVKRSIAIYGSVITLLTDGLAQIAFDLACVLHITPLLSGKSQKISYLGVLPAALYLAMNLIGVIGVFSPPIANYEIFKGVSLLILALSRCILQSGLCFLTGIHKVKNKDVPGGIFYPVVASLLFLVSSIVGYNIKDYENGLISFAWTLDFLCFFVLDRFISSK